MPKAKTIEERLKEDHLTGKQLGLLLFDAQGNFRVNPSLGYSEISKIDKKAKDLDCQNAQIYLHYESLVYALDHYTTSRGEVNYYGLRYAENLICRDLQDYLYRDDVLKIFHPTPEQLSVIDKGILARRDDMYREQKRLVIYDTETHTLNIDSFIFIIEKLYIPALKEAIAFEVLLGLLKKHYGISATAVKRLSRKNKDNHTMFEQLQNIVKIYGTADMTDYFSSVREDLLQPNEYSVIFVSDTLKEWKRSQGRYSVESIMMLISRLLMPPMELKTKPKGGENGKHN